MSAKGATFSGSTLISSKQAHKMSRSRLLVCASEDEAAEETPISLDINQIMSYLPHRYPFLLVDKVTELVPGKYAIGVKNVTVNDNFFPGHFPQRPIMPGVLMVEAMAQTGGMILLNPSEDGEGTNDEFFFGGVDKCKFRRVVIPGDVLTMKVTLTKLNKRFGMAKMQGKAYVGDELAAEAELTLVLTGNKV
ncbi:hypothetical protein CYMTET_46176 [Cymbomonas tetramitiformis]|uniref:3-hydroxyacyl-[acyl-carrier-protein] dehydratase n=1 Tax=Cymbomonas tetramitiformis TaxID=36881 RepID=A0AAE0BY69_9CHLO|nr:hypothetical protein CYMTET_46176 [Cymbomonas tetramitiformis]